MKTALHAEWTKLRTVPGTGWLLVAIVVVTAGLGGLAAGSGCDGCDPVKTSLTGVYLGQAVVVILAVLVISGEYSSGMVRTTLTAIPRRPVALGAKVLVVAGVVAAAGVVAVVGSLLAGAALLPGLGAGGPMLRAAAGSVLYLALIALLSLGTATAVRDSATAIGLVLGVLYLVPILVAVVPDPEWQRQLERLGPMTAGLSVQATTGLDALPIAPWAGLGVLAAWAAAALVGGGLLWSRRDA
ncbi:ABC transporter [Amycolatopsis deserti]|uniref:ABC transporter n=1 Tax=Amycolatopsis deserti TaxID=185696 RepID=A0ABQ3JJC4_9PSEU|nr:ABC transporter permease [Amycolatopsis deserti]GHF29313.1 ABC transporter [Amycolatopsis deserti]